MKIEVYMPSPSASGSFALRMSALIASLFVITTLLSRCGGTGGGKSGAAAVYSNVYNGSYEPYAGAALNAAAVGFTISWNEEDEVITGLYRDNHFAPLAVPVSGSVQNGVRILIILLDEPVDGVAKLTIATEAVEGELSATLTIANLAALTVEGSVLFEKNGVVMSKGDGGAGGGAGGANNSSVFFADIAGDYDFYAKNTNGVGIGTDWSHGGKYKVNVSADGKITIPTNDQAAPKVYTFAANPEDTYEKYDHEEYAVLNGDDGLKVLAQRHFNNNELKVSWQITDGPFWIFQAAEPGPAPNVFSDVELDYIVGTHTYKITNVGGENANDFKSGDPVTITITADGKVSGTFGAFTYVRNETTVGTSTMNGMPRGDITFYRPDAKTFPQWSLYLMFENKVFKQAVATSRTQNAPNLGRKYYNVEVGK